MPLSETETQELKDRLAKLHRSDRQAIEDGVKCLPKTEQQRAKLDWVRRWKSEF